MKNKIFILSIFCILILITGCSKEEKEITGMPNHHLYYTVLDFNTMKTDVIEINIKTLEKETLATTTAGVIMLHYDDDTLYGIFGNRIGYIDNNKIKYITTEDEYISRYNVKNSKIYYGKNNNNVSDNIFESFAMKDKSGQNEKKIHEMGVSQLIVDDAIYYRPDSGTDVIKLLKYKLDGTNKTVLYQGSLGQLIKYNDYLYYVDYNDNKSLYKMKSDGTNITKLVEGPFVFTNYNINQIDGYTNMGVIDGYLYFINSNDEYKLYKTNGTITKKVVNEALSSVNIIDDYIYCTYKDYTKPGIYLLDKNGKEIKQIINTIVSEYIISK